MSEEENLEQFRSNLSLIKAMTGEKAEEEFYQLMEKAKNAFGQLSVYMAEFYFEYAKFLLQKMEKNIDIFNAGSLPVGDNGANPQLVEEDVYDAPSDEDSSNQNNFAKSENSVNHSRHQQQVENAQPENAQPTITENNQKDQKGQKIQADKQEAGDDDDCEVCAQNLLCAIKIFESERQRIKEGGEQGKYTAIQIQRWISRCKSRLGDLYQLSQNYEESINIYRQVLHDEQQKLGHESNRGLAQIHYMIGNSFLYENKEGCQKQAIIQFVISVQILIQHLNLLNPDDNTTYQAPNHENVKVDRFSYLPKSTDSEETKEIKQVLTCLLDKIEDTFEQITIRKQYDAERQRLMGVQNQGQFRQVNPEATVVRLGTFGNRKKKAEQAQAEEQKKHHE